MSGNRTVGDVLLKMECDNRRMLRSLINIKMEASKITGNPTSTNCPNCGAPIAKSQCEYCGTVFADLAEQEAEMERLRKEQARLQIQALNAIMQF